MKRRNATSAAHVIRALAMLPATEAEIAAALNGRKPTIALWMRALEFRRVVHVAEVRDLGAGRYARVWALGAGASVPCCYDSLRKRPARPGAHVLNVATVWNAMEVASVSREVAEATGIEQRQAQGLIAEFRRAGLAHIEAWAPAGQNYAPAYKRGPGKDAPKPRKQSRRAVNARYYERRRAALTVQPLHRALTVPLQAREAA